MKRVIAARNSRSLKKPTIEWKYVVFNWNDQDEQIKTAIRLAENAGVDLISFVQGGGPTDHVSTRYADSLFLNH